MKKFLQIFLSLWMLSPAPPAMATSWTVGAGKTYATVSAAHASGSVANGDTLLVDPATYTDTVTFTKRLVVKSSAAPTRFVVNVTGLSLPESKGAYLFKASASGSIIRDAEIYGARLPYPTFLDPNGASVRVDNPYPDKLKFYNCYFHDSDDGFLGGANDTLWFYDSEFAFNGFGTGQTHNVYVNGGGGVFWAEGCFSHESNSGHCFKSRAAETHLEYCRVQSGPTGTTDYEIDVPDCGRTYIIGCVIEQGPLSVNGFIVKYGAESESQGNKDLYLINNTLVNNRSGGTFIDARSGTTVKDHNNIFYDVAGTATIHGNGTYTTANQYIETGGANNAKFVAPNLYDFRFTGATPTPPLNSGTSPGTSSTGYSLTPTKHYVYNLGTTTRPTVSTIDIGAFEYQPSGGGSPCQ